jgi:pimeloyl-ACP methyl ester carboxylesterase
VPADEVDAALREARPARALVVHDADDREVPAADAERLAAGLPDAQLMLTRGLGHRRILRDVAVAEAVADFIARATPAH